jgi:HisJ family histidinol phosphate phosphatase
MLFLWFYHACRRGAPRFMMVADHINYLTFEDPAAVHVVRRALKLAQAGDLYGAAETAGVELGHASVVSEGLRKGMRYSIGAEVDNDPRSRPDAQNIVDAMKPDGLIRSVHFLPITHPQHGENWMWAFDNPEFKEFYEVVGTERVWEIYMETLLDAIDKLPGHIVGHFYVPAKFGHWPEDATLEAYEDRLIDACAERGMAVEVNSRYLYKYYVGDDAQLEKFRTAHLRLMRKAKAKGVMVAVGSDAHSPRDQGGAFEAVLALLDEADINEIAFPLNDRLARVALRATEEILRQHSAALAEARTPTRPRVGLPPDPPDDDDASDDDTERAAEPPRVESANPDAEIILPPEPEQEPEPEEPAVAAAPKVKAPPKPRKSRAKVPVAASALAVDAPEEPSPIVEPAASTAEPTAEPQPELVAAVASVSEPTPAAPAPEKRVAPKRAATKPVSVPPAEPEPAPAPVVAKVAKAAPAPKPPVAKPPAAKTPAAKPSAKPPVTKQVAPKAAASKAAPVRKAEPVAKKAPPAKPVPKKAVAAKKAAPVKKAAPKKTVPAKKAATKAVPPKTAAKKTAKKKPPAKKAPAKKTAVKKTTAKPAAKKTGRTGATSAKRAVTKRPAPKKPAAKKTAKKKSARR